MAEKPATESTCTQGTPKSPNPSGDDLKPPSVLERADNGENSPERYPGSWPLFFH